MIKNILIILILVFGFSFSEVSHSRLTGTNIHTVYRWQFADSAARVNQSVSAADTMKLAYQRSDSTSWILVSTTGTKWKKVAYASNQNTLTTSTMTLDSLKLTKGINATGGTFSGRITGSDIEVSDSLKAATGSFSNLTGGYTPYQNSTGTLVNAPIYTNGTNTSIGKSSVESWGVTQRAVQVGGNTAIMGNAAESGSNFTWLLNNAYYDGAWKPYSNGSTSSFRIGATGILFEHDTGLTADIGYSPTTRLSWTLSGGLNVTNKIVTSDSIIAASGKFSGRITASDIQLTDSVKGVSGSFSGALISTTLNTGNGANELYAMDQNVRTSDAVTFTTLNTGYGANELHPMNQGVRTTDDVTFDSTRTRVSVFDSIKLGTGSYLKNYLDTTFYDSLFDGSTYRVRGLARIVQVGKTVTLYQPSLSGTISGSSGAYIRGIPSKFINSTITYYPLVNIVENGTSWIVGMLRFDPTYVMIQKGGVSLAAGNGGIHQQCITWIID